jgi:hypothetical protein
VLLHDKTTREIEQACAAALYEPVQWTALTVGLPEPGEHVMVKKDDGIVEIRYWDSARTSWSQSPFESVGQPVAWAPVPRLDMSAALAR